MYYMIKRVHENNIEAVQTFYMFWFSQVFFYQIIYLVLGIRMPPTEIEPKVVIKLYSNYDTKSCMKYLNKQKYEILKHDNPQMLVQPVL